jgi:hypothetical protein
MTDPTPLARRHDHARDLEELERTIREAPQPPAREDHRPAARPAPRPPVRISTPDNTPLDDLGRMSAEAVLTQYEAAAKAVEDMGISVKDRVNKIAAALLECDADMKEIAETAKSIREKGEHVRAQIEEASALSNDIRAACIEFKKKVGL